MKQLAILTLFFTLSASAQVSSGGSGVTVGSAVLQGPSAPYPDAPVSPTSVSACQNFGAGPFQLTANIGSDPTVQCGTIAANTKLDLNGFTITGRLNGFGLSGLNGLRIWSSQPGAQIICEFTDASGAGCLGLAGSTTACSATAEISHIKIRNNVTTSGATTNGLYVNWYHSSASANPCVWIHYVDAQVAGISNSSRQRNINVLGSNRALIENNIATCVAAAATCQGIETYEMDDAIIRRNLVTLETTANAAFRGILCDAEGGGVKAGCQVYENTIIANNNRALHRRAYTSPSFFNNVILYIHDTNAIGAIGLVEGTGGEDSDSHVWNNTLHFSGTGGIGIGIRETFNNFVTNNRGTGSTTCTFGAITWLATQTEGTFKYNSHSCGSASTVNANGTVFHCSSGSWTGAGTITQQCP